MPAAVTEFVIEDGGPVELTLEAGSFSKLRYLQRIAIHNVASLSIQKHAFSNLSSSHFLMEIVNCLRVNIDSQAFFSTKGPISLTITNSVYVMLHAAAFAWVLNLKLSRISDLRLTENVFSFETQRMTRHGPSTKVV